jgi:alpha-1,6-mannosyltransferase
VIPARLRRDEGALLYLLLAGALFALMSIQTIVQTRDGSWVGDFWEHSAVVRELARHLVHPEQPLLRLDEPHAFFSPYALALAAFARVTGLGAVTTLGAVGIVNLLLLLTALPRFVRIFTAEALAPFLTLLFTLFLWGVHPIVYSGFLHFDVLGLVLPYPSTFATAVSLWAVVVWAAHLEQPRRWRVAAVALAAAVVLLTHPVAAFFLVVLLAGLSAQRLGRGAARVSALALVGAVMLAAAALWPYYPFFRLLGEESVFDASNRALYLQMFVQVLPALVGVPFLLLRLRRSRVDPLVLTAVAVAVLYAVGDATSHWSLGRVLPYGVLVLDVVLADRISAGLGRGRAAAAGAAAAAVVLVALQVKVMAIEKPFVQALPRSVFPSLTDVDRSESVGPAYARLFEGVARGSVTMATTRAGWEVPTYGGRVVAALHPQAFVGDLAQREQDVGTFFDPATGAAVRRRLLCRYGATYVLVQRDDGGVAPAALGGLAHEVRAAGRYVLLVRRSACP